MSKIFSKESIVTDIPDSQQCLGTELRDPESFQDPVHTDILGRESFDQKEG